MSWSRQSTDKLIEAEEKLISYMKIPVEQGYFNYQQGESLFYMITGPVDAPPLLLIHGLCASGLMFYSGIPKLSERYRVYTLDLLGMGRSSRPKVKFQSREEAENFFTKGIYAFIQNFNLDDIVLVGHSFGGYISCSLAQKYQHKFKQLILLSPAGLEEKPIIPIEEALLALPWYARTFWNFFFFLWKFNITPMDFLRFTGPMSGQVVKIWTRNKLQGVPQEEFAALEEYIEQINLGQGSGEYALKQIFIVGGQAYYPLAPRIRELQIPVGLMYGDYEDYWLPAAQELAIEQNHVKIKIIPDCGHQLFFDQPLESSSQLLELIEELKLA